MRYYILVVIILGGLHAYAQTNFANPVQNYLKGWFGTVDPRQAADDSQPEALTVQKLLLDDDHWCSAVMIAPQWAVTAAHCITGNPNSLQFYRDNYPDTEIRVDNSWDGPAYGKFSTVDSIRILYQDYGFVHLHAAAPGWVPFAQVAQPNEVYVGETAKSIGFPADRFNGETRVTAGNCGVRRLVSDAILSDCAVSEGNSGGGLFVKTRTGEWKLGAVASTEEGNNNNGEYMIQGGPYSDALANHFLNITIYSGYIASVILNYDGEKLSTLSAPPQQQLVSHQR